MNQELNRKIKYKDNFYLVICIISVLISIIVIITLPSTDIFALNELQFGPYQFVPIYFWIVFIILSIFVFIFIVNKSIRFKSILKERICYLLLGLSLGVLSIGSLSTLFPYGNLADSWHNIAFSEKLILDGTFHSTYIISYPIFYFFNGLILAIPGISPEFLIQIYPIICIILYLIGIFLLIQNFLKVFFPNTTNSQQNKIWLTSFYFICVFGSKLGLRTNPAPQTLGYILLIFFIAFFFKQVEKRNNINRILPIVLAVIILFTHLIVFAYLMFFLLIVLIFIKEFRKEITINIIVLIPVLVTWFLFIFMNYLYSDPFIQTYFGFIIDFIIDYYFILIILAISAIIILFLLKYSSKIFKNKKFYWSFTGPFLIFMLLPIFDMIDFSLYFIIQILIYFFIIIAILYSIFSIFNKYEINVRNFSFIWILSLSIFVIPWIAFLFLGTSTAFLERIFLYAIIPSGVIVSVSIVKMQKSRLKYGLIFLFLVFGSFSMLSAQHHPMYAVDGDVVNGYKQLELNIPENEDYKIISLYLWPHNIELLKVGRYSGIHLLIEDYLDYLINGDFSWLYDVIYFCIEERAIQNYFDLGINLTELIDTYFSSPHPNTIITPFYQGIHLTIWNITAI